MGQNYTLPEWVTPSLNAIESHLHDHGDEIAELRGTGVAEFRVRALYPFEPEAYYAGVKRLFADGAAHAQLPAVFGFANVYQTVVTQLPEAQRAVCSALRDHRQVAPQEIQLLTTKKLLFDNVLQLPLVLRILREHYPLGESADWFRGAEGPALLAASLPLLGSVAEEFVEYLAAHMPPPAKA